MAQPFIRYDTGDPGRTRWRRLLLWKTRLASLETGRGTAGGKAVTHSGKHISVHFFTLLLEDLQERILQFQVIAGKGFAPLLVVPGREYTKETNQELISRIKSHTGEDMHIEVQVVKEIPVFGRWGRGRC